MDGSGTTQTSDAGPLATSGDSAESALPTLKDSPLLRECSDVDLATLRSRSSEVVLSPGELLFAENDTADAVWVVIEGTLVITKLADGDEIVVDHVAPGGFIGEISFLTKSPAGHRARANGSVRLLRIPAAVFVELLRTCQGVPVTVLRTMAERVRRIEQLLQQRERMAGLGTLAAGLTHELNNPSTAVKRAAALLKERVEALQPLAERLASRSWSPTEVALLRQLEAATASEESDATEDALARSDRADAIGRWLEAHGIDRAWELAPVLVERGVSVETLDSVMRGCDPSAISDALAWAEHMAAIRQMLEEIEGSAKRIVQVVKAVKAYSYSDATAIRSADVHEGIENSLTILTHKLRDVRATVERNYDRTLPPIETYGGELGQVWTNLLDNAADAIATNAVPGGRVGVRTRSDRGGVLVEVSDSGPVIPPDVLPKIFDPFFTTKEVGKGTGLGLEIARRIVTRHGGTIDVTSVPGDTRFSVWLPIRIRGRSDGGAAR